METFQETHQVLATTLVVVAVVLIKQELQVLLLDRVRGVMEAQLELLHHNHEAPQVESVLKVRTDWDRAAGQGENVRG